MHPNTLKGLQIGWQTACLRKNPANELVCPVCGCSFKRRGSRKQNFKHTCCSRECAARIRGPILGFQIKEKRGAMLSCKICGRLFYSFPSWRGRKYCSFKCRDVDPQNWDGIRNVKHYNWQGGVTPLRRKLRQSPQMRKWRKNVFTRDGFACHICRHRGKGLQAHHRKSWSLYPLLRYELDNGITLCKKCHTVIHVLLRKLDSDYEELQARYDL